MIVEHQSTTFDDTSMFGDNTDRLNDIMAEPSVGMSQIVRYSVPERILSRVQCLAFSVDYNARLLSGAYVSGQDGAQIQLRFGGVIKLEQKFNWTGLNGYIGGADDYGAENEIMLSCYDTDVDASTAIDIYFTGKTVVRRIVYATLYGVLDDGTVVVEDVKQTVDGTTATAIAVYTVPAGRTLNLQQIVITTRHIDLYAGKAYLTYNGLAVMAFDAMQSEVGGVYGLVFPFYNLPLRESASLGFRMDSYACGDEVVSGSVYACEEIVVPTPEEVAAAVWTYADRTLTA